MEYSKEIAPIDANILEILREDGRTSLTEIGKKIGISRFTVRNRIARMFKLGIIRGWTVVVNPIAVGYARTVFFEFKTNPQEPWLAEMLEQMDCCETLDGTIGEYSLIARFRFRNDEQFSHTLRRIDELVSKSKFKKYHMIDAIYTYKESDVVLTEVAMSLKIDEVDLKILDLLQKQWRDTIVPSPLTTTEISEKLRAQKMLISQPAVHRRITNLQNNGVILRHTVAIDFAKLGRDLKFLVKIKVDPAAYDHVARKFLAPLKEIVDLYRTGEDYGLLAVVRVKGVQEYNAFIVKLYSLEKLLDTFTTLILEERKRGTIPIIMPSRSKT
jgi:Lrp/AsnC family leucine-responsive transcriptional regulator